MLVHLIELRRRVIHSVVFYIGAFVIFFSLAPNLFYMLVSSLLAILPGQDSLVATQITAPLLTPIKLAADAALLCTMPYILLQTWLFAAPGLYRQERRAFGFAIVGSLALFFLGLLFGFYFVLPFMFEFFAHALPKGVRLLPDMAYAVDFITRMLLIFGLCFQVPLICLLLVRLQLLNITTLKMIRPYIIVAAFTIGMLLTPPDVLSQLMLAIPLCLLYEIGILLARWTSLRAN